MHRRSLRHWNETLNANGTGSVVRFLFVHRLGRKGEHEKTALWAYGLICLAMFVSVEMRSFGAVVCHFGSTCDRIRNQLDETWLHSARRISGGISEERYSRSFNFLWSFWTHEARTLIQRIVWCGEVRDRRNLGSRKYCLHCVSLRFSCFRMCSSEHLFWKLSCVIFLCFTYTLFHIPVF